MIHSRIVGGVRNDRYVLLDLCPMDACFTSGEEWSETRRRPPPDATDMTGLAMDHTFAVSLQCQSFPMHTDGLADHSQSIRLTPALHSHRPIGHGANHPLLSPSLTVKRISSLVSRLSSLVSVSSSSLLIHPHPSIMADGRSFLSASQSGCRRVDDRVAPLPR